MTLISVILAIASGLMSIPVTVLFIEVVAALKTPRPARPLNRADAKRVVVIVPAHNESAGIIPTIGDIRPQLQAGDRLIVVADNCTDDTAAVAKAHGAEVIERNDSKKIGKGYALGWGIDHISPEPPDFVIFIDADCRVEPDVIGSLTATCGKVQRPVQACFLMRTAESSPIDHSLAEFFFLVRNWARPLGLSHLNLPVQLMGTGMAFPWKLIHAAPLASGHLVEDLKLGLDLAAIGKAPFFLPGAKVTSDFPVTSKGTDSQRQRWVQGHLGMILNSVPRLAIRAIARRNLELVVIVLDVLVPPLSLLGLLLAVLLAIELCAAAVGTTPMAGLPVAVVNFLLFSISIGLAWLKFGRDVLPARCFWTIVPLVVKKLRLYGQMLAGRTVTQWVRTDRGKR